MIFAQICDPADLIKYHRRRSRSRSNSESRQRERRHRRKSNFDVRPPGVTEENAAAYAAQAILQHNMAALSGAVGPASFGPPPSNSTNVCNRLMFLPCSLS